jgi:hypothetical protein
MAMAIGLAGLLLVLANTFPAAQYLAAPIYCPEDTKERVVVARWGGSSNGNGQSLHWAMYCVNQAGIGLEPSTVLLELLLFAELLAVASLAVGLGTFARPRSAGGKA